MSAQQCFALCIDCWEFHYGISDSNGVFSRDSGSSNHWGHAVHVFGRPIDYPPPIRAMLASLHAGLPISDARMEIFSLACAVTALQPTNGIVAKPEAPKGFPVEVDAPGIGAEPIEPVQLDLFGGARVETVEPAPDDQLSLFEESA